MVVTRENQAEETREAMRGGPGSVTIRHLLPREALGPGMRLCSELTLPPGSGIGLHEHVDEDELYLIRQGTGLLEGSDGSRTVTAGDAVLTGSGGSHAITNTGSDDLVITAVIILH